MKNTTITRRVNKKVILPAKRHEFQSEAERKEVQWLIKEKVYKSEQEYLDSASRTLYGKPKYV